MGDLRTCSHCGVQTVVEDDTAVPDGWSLGTERGRVTITCPVCIRANVRSIEAKLSEEWWER